MFAYHHPLITQGTGRVKTDSLNEQRIDTILTRFEQWATNNNVSLKYNIDGEQLSRSRITFPLAGFAIGILCCSTFVHPNSQYIGKFFTLLTTFLGWKIHERYQQAFNISRYCGNYGAYPKDIQRVIDNNDSRYGFRWLKDDYLSIEI